MNIVDKLLESTDYIRLKTITETMKGNTFHHHYYILYPLRTLLGSEKKTYTEIGTFHGGSLSFMLEHPFDTEYHCIDPCMYPNQYENIHENIKLFNVNNRIVKHHKEFSTNQTFINQLISSKFNFSIIFLREVACFDFATLALKRRINSSNSAFFSSAFLFCCAF